MEFFESPLECSKRTDSRHVPIYNLTNIIKNKQKLCSFPTNIFLSKFHKMTKDNKTS